MSGTDSDFLYFTRPFLAPLAAYTCTFPLWGFMVERRGTFHVWPPRIGLNQDVRRFGCHRAKGRRALFLVLSTSFLLYSTLFETCTWGGFWVGECYSSTTEVFFVVREPNLCLRWGSFLMRTTECLVLAG